MKRLRSDSLRMVAAVLAAGCLVFTISACGGEDDEAGGGAEGSAAKGDGGVSLACKDGAITVGIAKAQSGGASFFDVAGARGAKIAIDQINADGGIKDCQIKTIEGDTKSDPAVGAQVARSLIDQGAQILLVPDDFDLGVAAARVGQEAGVLTLSTAAGSTEFAKAVGDKFFNGAPATNQFGDAQAQFALDKGWKRTFMVLDPGLAYFTEQDTAYRETFEAGGGEMAGTDKIDSLSGKADFGPTISKISAMDPPPDVIEAQMVFPPVGTFVKQLRSAGIDTAVLGNVTLQTRELPKLVGESRAHDIFYAGQVYFEGAGIDPDTDPDITAFTEQYEEKFGNFPEQANGPGSYQVMMAVNEALQQDDVVDAGSAANAIREQTDVAVPGGTLVRWEDGHAIWNVVINGIPQNGEFKNLDTVEAE